MDVSAYLNTYKLTARQLAQKIILDVLKTTGIPAAAGIGTNLYLCKVAMDIVAKHIPEDENGVRIAQLDEYSYRKLLWNHRPLTDFWRVGRGISKKLEENGMFTMGDVARCSLGKSTDYHNEDLLYKLFGINAQLLIDHAWGYEPCTMKEIKSYKPTNNSLGSGQVLHEPYTYKKTKVIVQEMADQLALSLVEKQLVTNQIVLTIGYDIDNLKGNTTYSGEISTDHYGRKMPKHAHGTIHLGKWTSSSRIIMDKSLELFNRIIDSELLTRRVSITACNVLLETEAMQIRKNTTVQLDLFTDLNKQIEDEQKAELELNKEKELQKTLIHIKKKYGKNSILKGMNLEEGATTKDRNEQIGGHKA